MTKEIKIKNIAIGKDNPKVVQTMCNIKTDKTSLVIDQIKQLEKYNCHLVRLSVLDESDAKAIKTIVDSVDSAIIADIHFDYKLALLAIENGAHKIRINPGNMNKEELKEVVKKCQEYHIPMRIGVNSGSVNEKFLAKYKDKTIAMVESLASYVSFIESLNFYDLVLSIKGSDITSTIEANRLLAKKYNYPLHIGITEAGSLIPSLVKSSYALGTLLNEGIGDTIRISITDEPVKEVLAAYELLNTLGLHQKSELISCPTCGRCQIDLVKAVNEFEPWLNSLNANIKVAIMGCVVNGPGEAKDADIGIAGGNKKAVLFKNGAIIKTIAENDIVACLKEEVLKIINERNQN